jgi:hypothetical protein
MIAAKKPCNFNALRIAAGVLGLKKIIPRPFPGG